MFYIGITFEEAKEGKEYKTDSGAKSAAEKKRVRVFDASGNVVADYTSVAAHDGPQDTPNAQDGQDTATTTEGADAAPDAQQGAKEKDGVTVTMTDDVPDGALDNDPDGSVKVYDNDGKEIGKISAEDMNKLMERATDGEMVNIAGKIRRVFPGLLRIRNRPSWDDSAIAGATNFEEKKVVGLVVVNEKPMFKTYDGYFVTGDPALVEYTAE